MSSTSTEVRAAVKKAATWGTALQCGAASGVMILPSEIKKTREYLVEDSLGTYYANTADQGPVKVEGELKAYMRYDGLDLLMALGVGSCGGAPVRQGSTAAYAQTLTPADTLDGLFATLAMHNGVNVDEYPSVKVAGLTLKGEAGKPLEVAFRLISNDRITGSTVNTVTTFNSVTTFETSNRVLFSQGVFRLNTRSGGAISDSDKVYPSGFTLKFDRTLKGIRTVGATPDAIDEPTNDGMPQCTLTLAFPRYTGVTHFSDWDASTAKKLDITFTGATIEAPYKRTFKLSFPNLAYKGVELPIKRGILEHPIEFRCLGNDAGPTGMETILKPFKVDLTNRQSANVLA